MQRSLLFALLLILIVVVFALQNSEELVIKLLFWDVQSSVALIMAVVLLLGAILGVLFSLPSIFKKNEKIHKLEEKLGNNVNAAKDHSSPLA